VKLRRILAVVAHNATIHPKHNTNIEKHMKLKPNIIALLLGVTSVASHAADIYVIGNSAYSQASFASTNSGVDGGLGAAVTVITGTNVTWTSDNTYFVSQRLFIPRGSTLTIQPGTKVYFGTSNTSPTDRLEHNVGCLIACRGGKLIADGTAANPIVFTSVREWEAANGVDNVIDGDSAVGPAPTSADSGQWGGIVLLGQAFMSTVNASGVNAGTLAIEGFTATGTGSYDGDSISDAAQYGPSTGFARNDADNSGILRYCSIRHGGYEITSGKEINGLTLGAVGSGTTIDYVEVYANLDDGIEFFGGRVSCNHMVMAFNQDDSFDIDEGYRGTNQFWFSIQNPGDADAGGEWDGVGGLSGGFTTLSTAGTEHHAKPVIYNATIIGAGSTNTLSVIPSRTGQVHTEKGNYALHIEDYFNGEVYNSVFHDFAQGLMKFNDAVSMGMSPKFEHNTLGSMGGGTPGANGTYMTGNATGVTQAQNLGFVFNAVGTALNGNSNVNTAPNFTTYTRDGSNFLTAINPIPAPGSPLLTSTVDGGGPVKTTYRGAFGTSNWAAGWTKLSASGILSGAAPTPAVVDADGDGISDTLEATSALTSLGFSAGVNNVTPTNLFSSLYTASTIQDLRGTGMMIGPVTGDSATVTLPLFKSTGLNTWTAAGNVTGTVNTTPGKQFFRVDLSTNAPNP